ncbi:hypothetical protein EA462_15240 [Natrarchaeobius halalkaliphilus]|uniref:Uncharacterized protein n=1 Tax=Natrarchaeobius halalkaliphilus TaxID=1679091 RepID=A0A3N6LKL9_9EURY|nr:hypothetical protein EA462_15240 [Natrarchaeobius halalkaliphilus]
MIESVTRRNGVEDAAGNATGDDERLAVRPNWEMSCEVNRRTSHGRDHRTRGRSERNPRRRPWH